MKLSTAFVLALIASGEDLTYEQIGERLDLSVATVGRCVCELVDGGYIVVTRPGNGHPYHYEVQRRPAVLDQVIGWFYRFTSGERGRRMLQADMAKRIYDGAHMLKRMRVDDPTWRRTRDRLFADYPDLLSVAAVWPLETEIQLLAIIDELLDWEEQHEPLPASVA